MPSQSGAGKGDRVVVGPGSGSEAPVRALLEQLAELWGGDCCSFAPLHLLFTPLTVTAVLKASDTEVLLMLLKILLLLPVYRMFPSNTSPHTFTITDQGLKATGVLMFLLI